MCIASPITVRAALVMILLTASGCASFPEMLWSKTKGEKFLGEKGTPQELLCLWQPAEGKGIDGLPSRGFSGQVFFFNRGSATPIRVEGNVRIYVFDDYGSVEERSKPIHQFDFPPEIWDLHLQPTAVGPAYQLFIPYTRRGSHQAECSIRVRYQDANGQTLFSELTDISLPGRLVEKSIRDLDMTEAQSTIERKLKANDENTTQEDASADSPATEPSGKSAVDAPSAPANPQQRLDRIEQMLEILMDQQPNGGGNAASVARVAIQEDADDSVKLRLSPKRRPQLSADHPLADFEAELQEDTGGPLPSTSPIRQVGHATDAESPARPPNRLPTFDTPSAPETGDTFDTFTIPIHRRR